MNLQDRLIEYIENNKFHCGIVLDDAGNRLRLVSQSGRELNLPCSRVVHSSSPLNFHNGTRDNLVKRLQDVNEFRRSLMPLINLSELWDLAIEEEHGVYSLDFLAELWFGRETTDDHVAAFLRCIFEDRLYFKYREGKIIAHPPEVVAQKKEAQEREREKEALLDEGAKKLVELGEKGDQCNWPTREKCLKLLADYYVYGNEAKEAELTRELLKRAQLTRPHDAYHLLVKAGVWRENENIALLRYSVPIDFTKEEQEQASNIEQSVSASLGDKARKDLRHLPLLTIDGEETRDFDDALHVERRGEDYLVGIHIADIAHLVRPGEPLFLAAMQRGTSLYFADQKVPMLPKELSEGAGSLFKDLPRLAMSFMVLISPRGEVRDFDVLSSIVRVHRQLTYPAVDRIIETDEELRVLYDLAVQLRQKRLAAGALLLPIPEVNIFLKASGEIEVERVEVDTPGRLLIAEFMILANSLGASFLVNRSVPGLFRCQQELKKRLVFGLERDIFLNFRQRKFLSPMELSVEPKLHSGLGVEQYTTLTSPLRRLLDLLMQGQINQVLRGKGALFSGHELRDYGRQITVVPTRANAVRQLRHRYWLIKYLEGKVGQRLAALFLEKSPWRIQVLLLDVLLIADLPLNSGTKAAPGDRISVRLEKASALDNVLKLGW